MNIPLFTVAIPFYNNASTIKRAILSVLDQTFKDFEILLVNDGSTDQTSSIIDCIKNPRLRVISHEKNQGRGEARNTCIREARGKYIAFLDSDDEWFPAKLESQYQAHLNIANPFSISVTAHEIYYIDTLMSKIRTPHPQKDWKRYILTTCDLGPGSTMVAPIQVFRIVGFFDPKLNRQEDHDWLVRFIFMGGEIIPISEVLARVYNTSKERTSPRDEQSITHFFSKHKPLYRPYGTRFFLKTQANAWAVMANRYLLCDKPYDKLRLTLKVTLLYPPLGLLMWLKMIDTKIGSPLLSMKQRFRDLPNISKS